MMLYNKYRPTSFSDVVSNEQVIRALKFQVGSSRGNYLLEGQRGTGKTTIAKICARLFVCEHLIDGEPCNCCPSCLQSLEGRHPDIKEIDGASNNGVNNIRDIIESLSYPALNGGYKVFIIDEIHMLSQGAFNALLKTVEEPPEKVVFIFATTEIDRIPATIRSRCQTYSFGKIDETLILERLMFVAEKEEISITEDAARLIAKAADGAIRDALSILQQLSCYKSITQSVVEESLGLIDQRELKAFTESLLKGNLDMALAQYYKIISLRTPQQLVNAVIKTFCENIMLRKDMVRSTKLLKELLVIKRNLKELEVLLALFIVECELSNSEIISTTDIIPEETNESYPDSDEVCQTEESLKPDVCDESPKSDVSEMIDTIMAKLAKL